MQSMYRTPILFVMALLGLAFLVPTPPLLSQESGDSKPAYVLVYVPSEARLTVDGTSTKQTGERRRFASPALPAGRKFVYKFKATWQENGKEVVREQEIRVEAGKEATVDLRQDAKAEAKQDTKTEAKQDTKKTDKPAADLDREPDVVYWPTPQPVVDKMLELAKLKKGDVLYDLGCGDARIPVTAALKYKVKAYGFDIDPERIKDSLENVKKNHVEDQVTIERKDIFTLDLSKANVVTLYLLPHLNVKLMPQLAKLKPGSRIISHDFDMKGAKPKEVVEVQAKNHMGVEGTHKIYVWEVPWEKEE
jgi:uncharacterized protein (TIGR03000 family)